MKCPNCKKQTDQKELERKYGKYSSITLSGFCNAQCYTKEFMKRVRNGMGTNTIEH